MLVLGREGTLSVEKCRYCASPLKVCYESAAVSGSATAQGPQAPFFCSCLMPWTHRHHNKQYPFSLYSGLKKGGLICSGGLCMH